MAVKFTRVDLNYILTQILMAEAGQPPVNALLSFGLREVAGTNNNLVAGQSTYGATDQVFPTMTDPLLQNAQYGTSYASLNAATGGMVYDAQPRLISNLISDQTADNPAALAAQIQEMSFLGAGYQNTTTPGADGLYGATTAYIVTDAGADGLYGTADDTIAEFGKDGLSGTNPLTQLNDDVTGVAGTLLHNIATGADGIYGATTAYSVTAGRDGLLGTADDVVDEFGANGVQDGNVAGSDDIIGTRASLLHTLSAGSDGIFGTADDVVTDDIVSDDIVSGNQATPTDASASSLAIPGLAQSLFINNVTPDNGLSAPSNSWFTFFGQFFDHGLDKIDTGGSGMVYIPLTKDDPLYVVGGHANFMVLTRATNLPGPDGIMGTADDVHQATNQTSPFVDQSQTYASDPSHQVFLREYMIGADGNLHSSGGLLGGTPSPGVDGILGTADDRYSMATWADLKANAANFLGIKITDSDVGNIPLLATDAYGNFIAGAHGLPQLVVRNADGTTSLVEGNLANPISTLNALRTGHAFINDMAHAASPLDDFGNVLAPDTDTALGQFNANGTTADPTKFYDNELLDAHYVAGDGRVNENIGLTAVQDIFHSEHERLLGLTKALIQGELSKGDVSFASSWVLPTVDLTIPTQTVSGVTDVDAQGNPIHIIAADEWNGERLFQAAKFGTETEYQHIVFDEFARYVAPSIHVAAGVNVHIDPAITSEFANVVYRFGHSMLDENVNLYQMDPATGKPMIDPTTGQPMMTQEGLIQAFTNPTLFASNSAMTADVVLGTVNQVSNAIDEFVTGTLRDNLLGLPLDLAALNIARGRDTGVAPLNLVRNQLFAQTGEAQLKAYANWADFGSQLKHPESLINFVAAYGKHSSITTIIDAVTGLSRDTTAAERRAAATTLVYKGTLGEGFNPADPASVDAYNFMHSQGPYANNVNDVRAIHHTVTAPGLDGVLGTADDIVTNPAADWSTGSVTGVDNIDMWVGGLAEKISLFGGKLGSTFEYVFRTQMEALQDADRLYYLPRIEGMSYEESLQDSSLAQLIRANTGIKHLPGNMFLTPEYTIEASDYFLTVRNDDGSVKLDVAGNPVFALQTDAYGNVMKDVNGTPLRVIKDPTGKSWLHNPQTGKLMVDVLPDGTVRFLGDDNFLGNTIVLGGTEGNDRLTAGAADDDTVWGDGGNDIIDGGGGSDFLFGGTGDDTVIGGQGDDTLHGDEGNDTIYGGDGADTIFGGDGNDYIEGGRGNDVIMGGLGNDIIIGNEGQDELTGGEGDDWIESRGGQGHLMFGDSGAPTGQVPLYSGNDVMIGGIAGGDIMKGFSGDDIMLGQGSFTKFIGGLGFDWASYEQSIHGVDADLNRKELVTANGAEDTVRDIFQSTEGLSGSAHDDILTGTNTTRLLATKDELDNAALIIGLPTFFAPGAVLFDAGNIILGGAGNDTIIGGGGDDIIDGDAFLHVALTKYAAGGEIIRQINYDPNGNTYVAAVLDGQGNFLTPASGNFNPANVDTAVYSDVMADYDIALFGKDAEGFLTVAHARAGAPIVGGNPQGLLGGNDGTDRIRNIERLQFSDATVAIDSNGNVLSSTVAFGPNIATFGYDTVPLGTPILTEDGGLVPATTVTVGNILTASVAAITDADGISTPFTLQWQVQDLLSAKWLDIVGATGTTFKVTTFQDGNPLRVKASYIDGLGYKETLVSAPTALVTLRGDINTAPTVVSQQQFNGIANTSALPNQPFDYFVPLTSIFLDAQTPSNLLNYTATLADGSSLASVGLSFNFDGTNGEFKTTAEGADGVLGTPDDNQLATPGQIAVRVRATDTGTPGPVPGPLLSVTNTFFINVLPLDNPPVANNDSYSILEDATLSVATVKLGVLGNDMDPDPLDRLTAQLVSGPAHGVLAFNKDGTFNYTPTLDYNGSDSFTYVANDIFLKSSNVATVNITVTPKAHVVTAALLHDTGSSSADGITNDSTLSGSGFVNAAVFASIDGAPPVRLATADATGAWSGTLVMADGKHTIVVSETSATGRTDQATVSFTLDTTPPPVTVGLLSDTGASATDNITQSAALNGISDPNSSVQVSIDGGAAVTVPTDAAGLYSYTPVVVDGLHTAVVTGSTDIAGNTGGANLTFTVDRVPPAVTEALLHDTGASATDRVTNDDTITGSGDANATIFAVIDGAAAVSVITANANGDWSFTPVLADGNHTVVVTETDLAGNSASKTLTFTLDTLPPPVTAKLLSDTGVSATDGITKVSTLTGTGDPNASVQISVDGGAAASIPTNAAGKWSFAPLVDDGSHTVSVNETDLAGNTGSATLAFILDTTPPAAPAITSLSAVPNATQTALTNYSISGTAEAGASVALSSVVAPSNAVAALGTATAAADGSWTFTVTPPAATPAALSNFSSTLTVTATDVAGNVSAEASRGLIVGTSTINTLSAAGSSIPTLIMGLAGNDSLIGGTGNDTLDGGLGNDTMAGGAGNDTYVVDAAGDVVTEANNAGTDQVLTNLTSYTLTANVENLTYTGAVAFVGTGNNLANIITGGTGADTLTGGTNIAGAGVDTLIGGAGNDTYNVSNVGDVIVEAAGGGTDIVRTTLASYTLGANLENLTFTGVGSFAAIGNALANTITGGAGNDTLDGAVNAAGVDTLIGGTGNDTYIIRNVGDVVTEAAGGGTDTVLTALASLTLAANVENLTFTGVGNFTGTGNNLANTITGGTGNDTLTGVLNITGVDTFIGGAGDDTYVVSNVGDVIVEAAGGGTDTVRTALASFTLAANVENLTYTGAAAFAGIGNNLANVITGGAGADTLTGGQNTTGVDTLLGGGGNDTYIVFNVGDVVTEAAGGGTDTVRTGLVSYTLDANVENLTYTGSGNFAGTGNTVANIITGGAGADTLDGGINTTGVDTLVGGAGNDTYIVRNVGDVVTETAVGNQTASTNGIDTVMAAINNYTLGANLENLTFIGTGDFTGTGNANANILTGGAGSDTLSGGAGNDTLIGGAGNDTMTGGTGNDIFKFLTAGFGNDTITDFNANATDLLDISAFGITTANFSSRVSIAVAGGATTVTVKDTASLAIGTVRLNGVDGVKTNVITIADFIHA